MKTIPAFLLGAAVSFGQPATVQRTPVRFAHVDFVRTMPGKAAEYRKAIDEKVVPAHQERVKAGKEIAFLNYGRQFPHGSGGEWSSIRMVISDAVDGAGEAAAGIGIPSGLFATVHGQLWRLMEAVEMEGFLRSKVVRVIFGKINPGRSADYDRFVRDSYKAQIQQRSGSSGSLHNGALFFRTAYPSGRDTPYDTVVMYGYDSLSKAVPSSPPESAATEIRNLNEILAGLRTVVNTEIWEQRQRTQ